MRRRSISRSLAVTTARGIGASSAGLVVGLVVDRFGYSAGFRALAGVAALAFGLLALALPETAPPSPAAETQPE